LVLVACALEQLSLPAVGENFQWVIQTTGGGMIWENSYVNLGRPTDCIAPDQAFHFLVHIIGENKDIFDCLDDSIRYRIFNVQSGIIYCHYSIKYLLTCYDRFYSHDEPFEVLT
jgi:hypothetical protein